MPHRPPDLLASAGFARTVFHDRHPTLIDRVAAGHPYTGDQRRRLRALLDESLTGRIGELPTDAADRDRWAAGGHLGRPWADAPFLWAESYFYRRILDAVDHFRPGPWHGVDPFAPMKDAELAELGPLSLVDRGPTAEVFATLVRAAVFGNRADLSFRMQVGDVHAGEAPDELLVDDTARLWELVADPGTRSVGIVTDNAGRELAADLTLAAWLRDTGLVAEVTLHVKPFPWYVSDATPSDVDALRRRVPADVAVRTHEVWCSPVTFADLPSGLLDAHQLVVVKGDLNYRRLVGDLAWDPTTPVRDAAPDLGVPLVALRTCKSEVVVGLDPPTVTRLDAAEPGWRISGRHGMVQAVA